MEEKTKGPVLWFGNYVDFGDFSSSVNCNIPDGEKEIFFDFDLDVDLEKEVVTDYYDYASSVFMDFDLDRDLVSLPLQFSLGVVNHGNITSASYMGVSSGDCKVELRFSGFDVCGFKAFNVKHGYEVSFKEEYRALNSIFFPRVLSADAMKSNKFKLLPTRNLPEVRHKFQRFLLDYHHKSKKESTVAGVVSKVRVGGREDVYSYLLKSFSSDKQFLKNLVGKEEYVRDISYLYSFCMHFQKIVDSANSALREFFLGVRYLGPVRASAERFYRYQDLQVNEIDHLGANLPMVINSLTESQKYRLKLWMEESFGFSLQLSGGGSHYALLIKEEGSETPFNISDMGFGYSQILPVVVSVWLEKEDIVDRVGYGFSRNHPQSVIVIEQPELHLHPLLQYRFAHAIAKLSASGGEKKIKFLFETHSKHIIDAFGDSVSNGLISDDDVNITIFDKEVGGSTKVVRSGYDAEGYLMNWPAGFLSA